MPGKKTHHEPHLDGPMSPQVYRRDGLGMARKVLGQSQEKRRNGAVGVRPLMLGEEHQPLAEVLGALEKDEEPAQQFQDTVDPLTPNADLKEPVDPLTDGNLFLVQSSTP